MRIIRITVNTIMFLFFSRCLLLQLGDLRLLRLQDDRQRMLLVLLMDAAAFVSIQYLGAGSPKISKCCNNFFDFPLNFSHT